MSAVRKVKDWSPMVAGLLLALLLPPAMGAAEPQASPGEVTEVTLYQGQAMVTRAIPVKAPQGSVEIVVGNLPEQVVTGSLFAEGSEGIEVRAVRFRTRAVTHPYPQAGQKPIRTLSNPVEIEILAGYDDPADDAATPRTEPPKSSTPKTAATVEANKVPALSAEQVKAFEGITLVAVVDLKNIDSWRSLGIRGGFGQGQPICDFKATTPYISKYGTSIEKGDRFTIASAKVSGSRDGFGNSGTKLILRSAAPKEGLALYCYGFDREQKSLWAIDIKEFKKAVDGYFTIEKENQTVEFSPRSIEVWAATESRGADGRKTAVNVAYPRPPVNEGSFFRGGLPAIETPHTATGTGY